MSPPQRKFPSELKTIKCTHPGCDKSFNRPARLVAHLRSHNNDRPFKCTYPDCDKSYIEEKHLKQHIKGSHTEERNYICPEEGCGKSFLTATRLRRHQSVHEGQERFKCRDYPPCNQTFRKHQTLQRHIRADHLHVSPYPCTYIDPRTGEPCGAGFDTPATLKRHEERHHGDLRFWCDECIRHLDENGQPKQTGFQTAWLLQNHMKQVHANCMFCGLSCNGRAELNAHIEEHHSQQSLELRKNIKCTWDGCDKTFTKKSNLYAHIRMVHEGVRFVCGEIDLRGTEDLATWPQHQGCGEGFATKAGLENHVRYIHLKHERPPGPSTASKSDQEGGLTLLQELAGVGGKSRRTVPCTMPGCPQKFFHASEREAHIHMHHGIGYGHEQASISDGMPGPMLSGPGDNPDHELQQLLSWDQTDEPATSYQAGSWGQAGEPTTSGQASQASQAGEDGGRWLGLYNIAEGLGLQLAPNGGMVETSPAGEDFVSLLDPALG